MLKKILNRSSRNIRFNCLKGYFAVQVPGKNPFDYSEKEFENLVQEINKPPTIFYAKIGITTAAFISTLPIMPVDSFSSASIALIGGISILLDRRIRTTLNDLRVGLKVEKSEMQNKTNQ